MQTRHYGVWPAGRMYSLPAWDNSIYENLEASAERTPDQPAIVYYDRTLSYRALLEQVRLLAGYLHCKAGVEPNDRVAVYMQNAPQFVIAYYAILAANAVVVPVNPMSREKELRHILADSGAKALLFGAELTERVGAVASDFQALHLIHARYADYADPATPLPLPKELTETQDSALGTSWDHALNTQARAPIHSRTQEDWAVIPYSSGTTGQPKGCLHTHGSVNATMRAYQPWFDIKDGSKLLACLPFCHVMGMQHSMNVPLLTGSTIYLLTRWNASAAAELIEKERIQIWRSITTMMIDFVSLPDVENRDLSSLEAVGGGGAQMPEAIAKKMHDVIGLPYIEAYGLTETIAPIHINPPQAPKKQCLGIPIFDVDTRVLDTNTMAELGPNEPGEIITSAPQLFKGYWNRPKETEAVFLNIDGNRFFRTGDIGYFDEEGYFFFVDRLKRMINVSGLKVWPAEVEAILHSHPSISEACVVADPDPRSGETVRAVMVPKQCEYRPDPQELAAWCRENMATYKVPKKFEFRDALPRSATGKVLWREL